MIAATGKRMFKRTREAIAAGAKECTSCLRYLQLESYYERPDSVAGTSYCKDCSVGIGGIWQRKNYLKVSARSKAASAKFGMEKPLRRKAHAARCTMRVRLAAAGRGDEDVASVDELTESLARFFADMGLDQTNKMHRLAVHNGHRVKLADGGKCTIENLFWEYSEANLAGHNLPIDLKSKLLLDAFLNHASAEVAARVKAALQTTETGCIQTAKSA